MINSSLVYAQGIHSAKSCNLEWVSPLSLVNKQSSAFLITLEKCSNVYSLLSLSIPDTHIPSWLMNFFFPEIDAEEMEAKSMVTSLSFFIIMLPSYSTNTYSVPTRAECWAGNREKRVNSMAGPAL